MEHTPTLHVEEMCLVLTKTLRGEITWGKEHEWTVEPSTGHVDAHGYIGQDKESQKSFILVRKYTDRVLGAVYNFWPVLFAIDDRGISPDTCIDAICNEKKIPEGSICYDGRDNKVFSKLIGAIQLVAQ